MLYGAIEAGGTKFVCAVGNAQLEVIERVSFETLNPGEHSNYILHDRCIYDDVIITFL